MFKQYAEKQMDKIAEQHGVLLEISGNDWAYDHHEEKIICPVNWEIMDDTDKIWRKAVLENHPDFETLQNVQQFVFNFYHELGHHVNGNDYDEIALRKILDWLAPINKELALLGYFELQSEKEATEWAIETILHAKEREVFVWWFNMD